ncbi:SHC-transforming protein 1-like [Uloborus diversus]|nr:SHC-transforming protein 1-like [Uloborus diversus]
MPKVRIQWSSNAQPLLGEAGMPSEWSKNGSLINKPPRGWLHPDSQVADGGVKYSVRYIGCLEVNTSMKSLDFDLRSQVAKECINKVCETAGLKTIDKKRKVDKRVLRMLAEKPNMDYAGSNVNLIITSSYMMLSVMESGEV